VSPRITRVLRWIPDPVKRSLKRVPLLKNATDRMYRSIGEEAVEIPDQGYAMYLDLRSPTQRSYATTHSTEDHVVRHLRKQLHAGDVMADVGGYVGYFTMMGARLVTDTGRVISFEPVPENAARIRRSAELNGFGNVRVEEIALSDGSEERKIWIEREEGGSPSSTSSLLGEGSESITIATLSFDSYVKEQALQRLDLVKIDVEGLEAEVVSGMQQTLARFGPELIVEFKDEEAARPCMALFERLGYGVQELGRTRHGLHLSAKPDG
jgi:FkbM family methyltransferase